MQKAILKMMAVLFFALGLSFGAIGADRSAVEQALCSDCKVQLVAKCAGFLEGVVLDPKGNIWMLDVMSGRILMANESGTCEERGRAGQFPSGAKLAPDGTITIVGQSGLFSFDPETGKTAKTSIMYDGEEVTGLNDLAYDQDGGLYITVPGHSDILTMTGRVFYISSEGTVKLVAEGLAFPNGIAVAPDQQTIFVAEFAAKRILSFPAVTNQQLLKINYVAAYTEEGIGPDGMVFDDAGRLFIANFGAGSLTVLDTANNRRSNIELDAFVGPYVTNMEVIGTTMLVTEAKRGEIWRLHLPRKN